MATFQLILSGSGNWTIPAGVTTVRAHCIGPGARGRSTSAQRAGGGAGAYTWNDLTGLTPGNTLAYAVGAENGAAATTFSTVSADYGRQPTSTTGGAGGLAANCVPSANAFSGGSGGSVISTGGGGAGGAGGPSGAGKNGGASDSSGAAAGGGSNGGSSTAGGVNSGGTGGTGGNGSGGTGGGTGGSANNAGGAATAGTGAGGGGGGGGTGAGGGGAQQDLWTDNSGGANNGVSAGPGGGGGGSGATAGTVAGAGGGRGSGAGGGPTLSAAGAGLIVLEYTVSLTASPSDSVTVTETLVSAVGHVLADSVTPTDALVQLVAKPVADSVTTSDTVVVSLSTVLADSVTPTDALTQAVAKVLADSVTASDVLEVTRPLDDTVTVSDTAVMALSRAFADSVTPGDSPSVVLEVPQIYLRNFNDSVTASESVSRRWRSTGTHAKTRINQTVWAPPHILRPDIRARTSMGRLHNQLLADSVAIGESAQIYRDSVSFVDSLSASDVVAKIFNKVLADSVTMADSVDLLTFPPKPSDMVTVTEGMVRSINKVLSDSVTMTESMTRAAATVLADSVTMADVTSLEGAQFVSSEFLTLSASVQMSYTGAQAGDIAFMFLLANGAANTPGGFTALGSYTWTTYGYIDRIYYKILDAGDISTGHSTAVSWSSEYTAHAEIWRGATTPAIVSTNTQSPTQLSLPGFTKNSLCRGLIMVATSRNPDISAWTIPPGTTSRLATSVSSYHARASASLAPGGYVSGTTETWDGNVGASGYDAAGYIIELT